MERTTRSSRRIIVKSPHAQPFERGVSFDTNVAGAHPVRAKPPIWRPSSQKVRNLTGGGTNFKRLGPNSFQFTHATGETGVVNMNRTPDFVEISHKIYSARGVFITEKRSKVYRKAQTVGGGTAFSPKRPGPIQTGERVTRHDLGNVPDLPQENPWDTLAHAYNWQGQTLFRPKSPTPKATKSKKRSRSLLGSRAGKSSRRQKSRSMRLPSKRSRRKSSRRRSRRMRSKRESHDYVVPEAPNVRARSVSTTPSRPSISIHVEVNHVSDNEDQSSASPPITVPAYLRSTKYAMLAGHGVAITAEQIRRSAPVKQTMVFRQTKESTPERTTMVTPLAPAKRNTKGVVYTQTENDVTAMLRGINYGPRIQLTNERSKLFPATKERSKSLVPKRTWTRRRHRQPVTPPNGRIAVTPPRSRPVTPSPDVSTPETKPLVGEMGKLRCNINVRVRRKTAPSVPLRFWEKPRSRSTRQVQNTQSSPLEFDCEFIQTRRPKLSGNSDNHQLSPRREIRKESPRKKSSDDIEQTLSMRRTFQQTPYKQESPRAPLISGGDEISQRGARSEVRFQSTDEVLSPDGTDVTLRRDTKRTVPEHLLEMEAIRKENDRIDRLEESGRFGLARVKREQLIEKAKVKRHESLIKQHKTGMKRSLVEDRMGAKGIFGSRKQSKITAEQQIRIHELRKQQREAFAADTPCVSRAASNESPKTLSDGVPMIDTESRKLSRKHSSKFVVSDSPSSSPHDRTFNVKSGSHFEMLD